MKRFYTVVLTLFFTILAPLSAKPKETQPLWYDFVTMEEVFPKAKYIARTGFGATEADAAAFAQADISAYFSQTVVSHTDATSTMKQNDDATSKSYSIERHVVIESAMKLFALHKTTPYYDKKNKKYAVCVYIDREEAFAAYEGQLLRLRRSFISPYNAAESEYDPLKKIIHYTKCLEVADEYAQSLDFARLLYLKGVEKYTDDYNKISSVESKMTQAKKSVQLNVKVTNDSSDKIKNCVKDILSQAGFFISDKKSDFVHLVNVDIDLHKILNGEVAVSEPSVTINIQNAGENIFSYSKNIPKITGFAEAQNFIERKAYHAIEQEIKNTFLDEFNKFLTSDD